MSKSVGCTTTCRFKFPKYFSWSWNTWPWFPVRVPKAAAALHLSTHGLREQICTERPQVCVLEKCACAFGRASWSPLQTVHQSVTNKPELESVLEIAASFPGFRFHLSALRQGFRTFATWNLEHSAERRCVHLGQIITYAGTWEAAQVKLYFRVRVFWMCYINA